MTEEVKAETTDTATPVQAVENTATPKIEQTTTETAKTETVDTAKPTETPKESGLSKGVKTEIYKLRQERRQAREEIETLKRQVAELSKTTAKPVEEPTPTFFDDPEKRFELERHKIKSELVSEIKAQEAAQLRQQQIEKEGQQTIEELLNKPEINGDMDKIQEIDDIILNDPRLSEIVKISPSMAGKYAYELWAKDKGIDPKSKEVATAARVASSTPAPQPMSAKGPMTLADIQAQAAKLDISDPQFSQKHATLMAEYLRLTKG